MSRAVYCYAFAAGVSLAEVQDSLLLAVFCAEGLHGRAQVRLDAGVCLDEKKRACVVDATTPVGQSVAQIFTELLTREFGEEAFTVERRGDRPSAAPDAQNP